jgi:RNA polymerase sigma-70 factor, ECF subfamily
MTTAAKTPPRHRSQRLPAQSHADPRRASGSRLLDPDRLPDHIDTLYRAAWALCGSRQDAEDLVQETLATVLKRPRVLRHGNELGYLMRALRNTYINGYRRTANRSPELELFEHDAATTDEDRVSAREIMEAIASAPELYREAVIAVDVLGLSYREAARSLGASEATVTSRLHRGRHHVAKKLLRVTGVEGGALGETA